MKHTVTLVVARTVVGSRGLTALRATLAGEMFIVLLPEKTFPQASAISAIPISLPSVEGKPRAGKLSQQLFFSVLLGLCAHSMVYSLG